jgi:hypothetical protein
VLQVNDLSRSLAAFDLISTLVVVVEHSGAAHVAFKRMKTLGPCDV